MEQPPNGHETNPADSTIDVFRDATATLRTLMDTFVRSANLIGLPKELTNLGGFQLAFQIVLMNNQSAFYNGMIHMLAEVLERTRAEDGGLDPRSIQREMARRHVDMAMGPDPEILQHLVQGANHASAVQEGELEDLRTEVVYLRTLLENLQKAEPETTEFRAMLMQAKLWTEQAKTTGTDPGSIPENVRIDGTTEPQL